MKIVFYISCLILLCSNTSFSQTNQEDLEKYWNYRSRFLGKDGNGGFISIGPEQGQSLPASYRDINCDCLRDWHLQNSKTELHKGKGVLKWGDGTVHLGYYLAMLAMEYHNLKTAKASTREIVREIYFALKAYERLDKQAEVLLGLEPELNGFFLRDDVPVDFYLDGEIGSRRFPHSAKGAYDCIGSDFAKGDRGLNNGNFISQDQAISLLFGFAFIKKFAGDVVYNKESKEAFGDLAIQYTHLIVSYLKENKWRIKSPDGQSISNRWGGDTRAFNSLFAEAAESITEGRFDYDYNKKTLIGRLAKGSYAWAFGLHSERNYSMIFQLMMISNQWSSERMAKRAVKSDKIFYALADAVLNDRKLDEIIEKKDFEELIKSAPIDGPCFGTEGCEAPDGWKSAQLWFHTNHKNGNPYGIKYQAPGVDFMLLYNLFYYYYQDDLPVFKNQLINPKYKKRVKREKEGVLVEDTQRS